MMAWHSAIEKLVGNTISHDSTASTSSKHKGEVTSTVAGVGLASSGASTTTATTVEEAAAAEEEDDEGSSEEEEGESEFVEAADASTPGAGTTGEGEAGSVRFGESTTIGEQDALPGYTGNGAQVPAEKKAPLEGDNAHQALAAGEGTSGGAVPTVSDGATSSDKHDLPPALSSASSSTPQAGASCLRSL